MFTKLLIVVAIVAICLAVYGLLAGFNGWWPFGGGNDGNGTAIGMNSPDDAPRPPEAYTIEVHEGRILYMNNEVTLDELEEILERYRHLNEVWILTDAFRAYSVVFENVRGVLRAQDIVFAEN